MKAVPFHSIHSQSSSADNTVRYIPQVASLSRDLAKVGEGGDCGLVEINLYRNAMSPRCSKSWISDQEIAEMCFVWSFFSSTFMPVNVVYQINFN